MTNSELILELKNRFELDSAAQVFSWGSWDNHHATVRVGTSSDKMDRDLQAEISLSSYPFVLAAIDKTGEAFFFFFDDIKNSLDIIFTVFSHEDNYKMANLFYASYGKEQYMKEVDFGLVINRNGFGLNISNFGSIVDGKAVKRAVIHQRSNLMLKDYRFYDYLMFNGNVDELPFETFNGAFRFNEVEVEEIHLHNVMELGYYVGNEETFVEGERFFGDSIETVAAMERHMQSGIAKGWHPFAVIDNEVIEPVSVAGIMGKMRQSYAAWEEVYEMGLEE